MHGYAARIAAAQKALVDARRQPEQAGPIRPVPGLSGAVRCAGCRGRARSKVCLRFRTEALWSVTTTNPLLAIVIASHVVVHTPAMTRWL